MAEMIQRTLIFVLGGLLLAGSIFMFTNSKRLYNWTENYRDRFPMVRVLNPLARLNSPTLSRISAVWIGFIMFLMGTLLVVGSIYGRMEP
jgi:hypothetical protein